MLVDFRRDSFLVSYGDLSRMGSDEAYLTWLARHAQDFPDGFLLFEEDPHGPVAQLEMRPRRFEEGIAGYVNLYYVRRDRRRWGLGRQLHEHASRTFREMGYASMYLKVSASNAVALAFYERLGFREHADEDGGSVRVLRLDLRGASVQDRTR